MPKQVLGARPDRGDRKVRSRLIPKILVGALSVVGAVLGTYEMYQVLSVAGMIILEWVLLGLFSVNLAWICFAFVSATAGLFAALLARKRRRPSEWAPSTKTAMLFPVYNEDARRVFATVLAVSKALGRIAPGQFECFILADTNRPEAALGEEATFLHVKSREHTGCPIFYRRRTINHERKSGNVEDFVSRWGGRYDNMIVFDADSHMSENTILELVWRMETDPGAGLIQTIPQLVEGRTLFARSQQFAGALYGPVLGAGVAWWAQTEGNFWGHNAIIRVRAFADAAGLPSLEGKPPFGGAIMSHDFIEAALLRKAGWKVIIASDLKGSYEECPPSIVDLTIRDRRWCQGNLQHLAVLLRTKAMAWTNRLHIIIGVMSYLAAPLWLALILVGMALSLQAQFLRPEYFGEGVNLFPNWPVIDSARALRLFWVTMAILFAPKIYGLAYGIVDRTWRRLVGPGRVLAGVLVETLISILLAPILLVAQSTAVISILLGRDAGWSPQKRAGEYSWSQLLRRHYRTTLFGVALTATALAISPVFAAWLAPATVGMILAPLLSILTGSERVGTALRRWGILLTPEEVRRPASVRRSNDEAASMGPLEPFPLTALLTDEARRQRRSPLVDPYWNLGEGEVHVPLATAIAKAHRYGGKAALAHLSDKEAMAILNAPASLDELSRSASTGRVS